MLPVLFGTSCIKKGFTPQQISGLVWWLKSDAGLFTDSGMTTPAVNDNDRIGGWQDQSGQGRHLTGSGATRPFLKVNTLNGFPTVNITAAPNYLDTASITAIAAKTVLLVVKSGGTGTNYILVMGSDNNAIIQGFAAGKIEWYNTPRTQIADINTAAFLTVPCTVGATATGAWRLGASSGGSNGWSGYVAEILVYNSVLSAANLAAAKKYLANRWGV